MKLHGARVLLTGASRGIGRELALRLAGRGARLVLVGRDPSAVASVCNDVFALGGRADSIAFDLAAARSNAMESARPPSAKTSLQTLATADGSRPTSTSRAPRPANRRASSRPMPRLAPVRRTLAPCSFMRPP